MEKGCAKRLPST